ncbi:hypothetical protein AYR54_03550 [Loigolactobacillus backii]|uniref:hypothetical protein n=1 Tax=Loigolactobacillus backii TaxID=375175 RepID=UPI0007F04B86|nr:hypothetical protein [Loigolactobacillus backii]ANK59399.1 hypothetical protein AYR52_03540 [Loigolactobacillus backii]ANK64392.1 hypothetical protein AYR54_03550 [Loigolactobacillus backii]ANK67212.1 hypothetical protein AYR55_05490 [Loigolactobacillus backii]OLF68866.1 hypothetical protein ACX53_11070 [Loigolactobacillus backii]PIO87942.1 hypothetical protein B8A32_02275 [Loigolactobacillus backii]
MNLEGNGNTLATSLILIADNLADSLSPYIALLLQNGLHIASIRNLFWLNTLVFVLWAIVFAFISWRKKIV